MTSELEIEQQDNGIYYDVAAIRTPYPSGERIRYWEATFDCDMDFYGICAYKPTHKEAWEEVLEAMRSLRDELQKEIAKIEAEMREDEAEQSHFAHDEDGNWVLDENGEPVVVTDTLKWGTDPDPEA